MMSGSVPLVLAKEKCFQELARLTKQMPLPQQLLSFRVETLRKAYLSEIDKNKNTINTANAINALQKQINITKSLNEDAIRGFIDLKLAKTQEFEDYFKDNGYFKDSKQKATTIHEQKHNLLSDLFNLINDECNTKQSNPSKSCKPTAIANYDHSQTKHLIENYQNYFKSHFPFIRDEHLHYISAQLWKNQHAKLANHTIQAQKSLISLVQREFNIYQTINSLQEYFKQSHHIKNQLTTATAEHQNDKRVWRSERQSFTQQIYALQTKLKKLGCHEDTYNSDDAVYENYKRVIKEYQRINASLKDEVQSLNLKVKSMKAVILEYTQRSQANKEEITKLKKDVQTREQLIRTIEREYMGEKELIAMKVAYLEESLAKSKAEIRSNQQMFEQALLQFNSKGSYQQKYQQIPSQRNQSKYQQKHQYCNERHQYCNERGSSSKKRIDKIVNTIENHLKNQLKQSIYTTQNTKGNPWHSYGAQTEKKSYRRDKQNMFY